MRRLRSIKATAIASAALLISAVIRAICSSGLSPSRRCIIRVKEQMESRMAAAESTRRCRATPILRHGFRLLHRLPLRRRSAASEQTCKSSPEAPGCRLES